MNTPKIQHIEVPYQPDSCAVFERFRDLPGAALLDSAHGANRAGRYDIITACPDTQAPHPARSTDLKQWLAQAKDYHREHWGQLHRQLSHLPFCGGFLGYLEYEAGNALVQLPKASAPDHSAVSAYHWALVQDHQNQSSHLALLPGLDAATRNEVLGRCKSEGKPQVSEFKLLAAFESNMTEAQYREKFAQVQRYIHAGDCYQVNLAQRFNSRYQGDPWAAYLALRSTAQAPYSGFVTRANGALLCLSPERFMRCDGQRVNTAPIKGTRPRHSDPAKDQALRDELLHSPKDRAENLMIVDLLRNDLGRVCLPGSIGVETLFDVQSFATVHHLVSTISGELSPALNGFDLLANSFPGGSITGAPKRRAMQIIAELEPHPRQIFCGSLFFLSAHGVMDSNILIRSLLAENGEISAWAGGGLVADSVQSEEYSECFHKIIPLLEQLESLFFCVENCQNFKK